MQFSQTLAVTKWRCADHEYQHINDPVEQVTPEQRLAKTVQLFPEPSGSDPM
jgi:hypothetical protein